MYLQERKGKVKLEELGSLDLLPFRQRKLLEVSFRAYFRILLIWSNLGFLHALFALYLECERSHGDMVPRSGP